MIKSVYQDSPVTQWMSSTTYCVDRESNIRNVLEIMSRERLACVPVTDETGMVVGIVTLRDLAGLVLATDRILESDFPHYEDCFWAVDLIQKRLGSDKVTAVMCENVISVVPDTHMQDAAVLMTKHNIRHLAITGPQGLIGMLSADDFVRMLAS